MQHVSAIDQKPISNPMANQNQTNYSIPPKPIKEHKELFPR